MPNLRELMTQADRDLKRSYRIFYLAIGAVFLSLAINIAQAWKMYHLPPPVNDPEKTPPKPVPSGTIIRSVLPGLRQATFYAYMDNTPKA
jgi:hypothetical protein